MNSKNNSSLIIIQKFCIENNLTLAVSESVSGGNLQSLVCSSKQAGLFFEGGITLYNCRQKNRFFGFQEDECMPINGVSAKFSKIMANKTCGLFGSDIGISLTGFASPISKFNVNIPYAFGSISFKGKEVFSGMQKGTEEEASILRELYSKWIIDELAAIIKHRHWDLK
ncbi:CinA family protein [Belliella marina]|uniref:CinA family protein n=1 Tax=Belliella marina TaxID=1644146 RepID=A0ABW4VQ35_9BACT